MCLGIPRPTVRNGGRRQNWGLACELAGSASSAAQGWLPPVDSQAAPSECFIAFWKCLFSGHKFNGQSQGMCRNKAYHHLS